MEAEKRDPGNEVGVLGLEGENYGSALGQNVILVLEIDLVL